MDFVSWCDDILRLHLKAGEQTTYFRSIGVPEDALGQMLYGEEVARSADFFDSSRRLGLLSAIDSLSRLDLLESPNSGYSRLTPAGRDHIANSVPLWAEICGVRLSPEHTTLLRVVNGLSLLVADDHVHVQWVERDVFEQALGWSSRELVGPVAQELGELGLLVPYFLAGGGIRLKATYAGSVWETRRGFTLDSQLIDGLVEEWETTSVDFKRELHTGTADEKAELIKDLIGLANTQASGRRWLIVGFDDKTRSYFGPPDPKITQNHLEQLMSVYTAPVLDIKYEVVEYRSGLIGRLEVLRKPEKLPYRVAKDIGDRRRILAGQRFVRHGSQTEEPTPLELAALEQEGERARQTGAA